MLKKGGGGEDEELKKKGVKLKKFASDNLTYLYVREMGEDKDIDRLKRVVFGTAALRKKLTKVFQILVKLECINYTDFNFFFYFYKSFIQLTLMYYQSTGVKLVRVDIGRTQRIKGMTDLQPQYWQETSLKVATYIFP